MMRFPRQHLADQTLARIEIAARRASSRGIGPELEPEDAQLVDLPFMLPPAAGPEEGAGNATGAAPSMPPPAELPPLSSSGLDLGTVAQGGDSFDALTKGMG